MAAEFSRITITGVAAGRNEFVFLKPSLALTFQAFEALHLRAALRHTVGQLDFNDFAASADAEDDRFLGAIPISSPTRHGVPA